MLVSQLSMRPLPNPPPQAGEGADSAGRLCPADYTLPACGIRARAGFCRRHALCGGRAVRQSGGARSGREAGGAGAGPAADRVQRRFPLVRRRAGLVRGGRARRERHTRLARQCGDRNRAAADVGAGCGCAYPRSVDDGVVERSNAILANCAPRRRKRRARACARCRCIWWRRLGALRVGIVHGDACSLAGWRFAPEALDDARQPALADRGARAVERSTCSPAPIRASPRFATSRWSAGRLTVINNGAAGMPNFSGSRFGVITRIATSPSPHPPLYGLRATACISTRWRSPTTGRISQVAFLRAGRKARRRINSYYRAHRGRPDYRLEQAAPP